MAIGVIGTKMMTRNPIALKVVLMIALIKVINIHEFVKVMIMKIHMEVIVITTTNVMTKTVSIKVIVMNVIIRAILVKIIRAILVKIIRVILVNAVNMVPVNVINVKAKPDLPE
uniref:Transmembrane protein n=1 Tax=Pithovirus LCPAC201 TaxID=2506591 RepID=A0A481Z564_9VIRU|nr:MAG: hypothetical protein LCPAC201_02280 [Pithovirus LCPAC201]